MKSPALNRDKKLWETALIGLFFLTLGLPALESALHIDPAPALNEKRKLAEPPVLRGRQASWLSLPKEIESYFNDHLGFRKTLIRVNSRLSRLLGRSDDGIVYGKEGWLYYDSADFRTYWLRRPRLSGPQLARWRYWFESFHSFLSKRGIRYLVVIVPEKNEIYPEYLPSGKSDRLRNERVAQLSEYMHANSPVEFLYLRETLQKARGGLPLYYRTDTHWNDLGAFMGYQAVFTALSRKHPQLKPRALSDFESVVEPTQGLDLAVMLGLADQFKDEEVVLRPRQPRRAREVAPAGNLLGHNAQRLIMEQKDAPNLRLLLLKDSFGRKLGPFFAEHFRRSAYLHIVEHKEVIALIDEEKPDIVVHELYEPIIYDSPPGYPADRLHLQSLLGSGLKGFAQALGYGGR